MNRHKERSDRKHCRRPRIATVMSCGFALSVAMILLSPVVRADITYEALDECLLKSLKNATAATTVDELKVKCADQVSREQTAREVNAAGAEIVKSEQPSDVVASPNEASGSLIHQRMQREQVAQNVRSVLIPHRRNYIMPISYVSDPNEEPFKSQFGNVSQADQLDNLEVKFQISLKFSLLDDVFTEQDEIYLGFTVLSLWQTFKKDVSAPFRETNYEPEIFWIAPIEWNPFNLDAGLMSIGISHQSNGRGGSLSRSWNRVYAQLMWEKGRRVYSIKPWLRLPEDDKTDPLDPDGDDNPDISKYMGHFEAAMVYRDEGHELSVLLRNNFRSENKGAIQLGWTFPFWRGMRGYAQYFNGYGESLIDYDAHIERFGVGILLTDLL